MTPYRKTHQPAHRVAIVGGGLAGLLAANHMLDCDDSIRPVVFEAAGEFGGRARTNDVAEAKLNLGPHALYRRGHLARDLAQWAMDPSGGGPAGGFGARDGELHRLPGGPWGLISSGLIPGWSRFRFMSALATILRAEPADLAGISAADYIAECTQDEHAAATLAALGRLASYATEFDRLSADVFVGQFQLSIGGVMYPDGGWQTLVDALAGRVQAGGAELRRGTSVEGLSLADGGARIWAGGAAQTFDAAVLAVSPSRVQKLLGARKSKQAGLDRRPQPVRAACLDLVLEGESDGGVELCIGVDAPTYVSDHTACSHLADDGLRVVHAARYGGAELSAGETRRSIEAALDRAQPGWRAQVVEQRYLPRITVVEDTPTPDRGGLAGRAPVAPAGLDGVFLAGDWVGARGWLSDASAASAEEAAAAVARYLRRAYDTACAG